MLKKSSATAEREVPWYPERMSIGATVVVDGQGRIVRASADSNHHHDTKSRDPNAIAKVLAKAIRLARRADWHLLGSGEVLTVRVEANVPTKKPS